METVDGVEETSWEMRGGGNGMTIILFFDHMWLKKKDGKFPYL
jgi:hypothetical protein